MKNEYFVPEISDLRIGYEFEKFTQGRIFHEYGFLLPEEERDTEYKWRPCVIKSASDLLYIEAETHMDKPKPFTVPYNEHVRTPYLTKEQIEAEGWIPSQSSPNAHYTKDFRFIRVWNDTHTCESSIYDSEGNVVFNGDIKSINEFRYICKLLKI